MKSINPIKTVLSVLFLGMFMFNVNAQSFDEVVEKRAKADTELFKSELDLTTEQYDKVMEVNVKYHKNLYNTEENYVGSEALENRAKLVKEKLIEYRNYKFKTILTEEQMNKYLELQK